MSASMPNPIPSAGPITITGPLSIAELLDRTFRALRARFGVMILSAAMVIVPLGIVTALLSGRFITGYFDFLQFAMTDPESAELAIENALGEMAGYFGILMLLGILSSIGSSLVSLISMHHVQRFLHGESSTVADGWRTAIRRLLPYIGMQIAEFVVIGIATMVVAIAAGLMLVVVALIFGGAMAAINSEAAGLVLGIGLVIVFIIGYLILLVLMLAPTVLFMGRWLAAGPSLLIEGLGPIAALQRSWGLTKGRMWRGILYVVLLTILSTVVIGIPVGLTQMIAMIVIPSQMGLIGILSTVVSYILNLFYLPFYATGTVLFYYDLRVRAEAYDVALRVAALEAEVAPDAPPA